MRYAVTIERITDPERSVNMNTAWTIGFIAGILSTIVAVLIGLGWGYIKGFGAEVVAYEDLGAEAVRRLEVEDMPLTVVIDSTGANLYETGPAEYLASLG